MSRVIQSPVKKWAGSVTLADPLTFPAFIAWNDAMRDAHQYRATDEKPGDYLRYSAAVLPGILACVEKWELKGFSPDPFPATPRDSSCARSARSSKRAAKTTQNSGGGLCLGQRQRCAAAERDQSGAADKPIWR
jgi:hypothetical protein